MISLYQIKPKFQALLRPSVRFMAKKGVTANSVTLAAMVISLMVAGIIVFWGNTHRELFLLLPIWMLLRMAMNAIDGMLAREFGQKSPLGAYLNELTDVISDAALYLPFYFIAPFNLALIFSIIFMAALSEMAGIMAHAVGSERRYDGPIGKSDRALVFGLLGLWVGIMGTLPTIIIYLVIILLLGMGLNIIFRIRSGIASIPK